MSVISRRNILKLMAFFYTSAFVNLPARALQILNEYRDEHQFSFEKFNLLSQILTGSTDINENISQKIYQLVLQEPWGPVHLEQVFHRIRNLYMQKDNGETLTLGATDFTADEQWFISHLLLTWYTGVYYHERGNQNVTMAHAIMYKILAQFMWPQTYCGGQPGFWALPPDSKV